MLYTLAAARAAARSSSSPAHSPCSSSAERRVARAMLSGTFLSAVLVAAASSMDKVFILSVKSWERDALLNFDGRARSSSTSAGRRISRLNAITSAKSFAFNAAMSSSGAGRPRASWDAWRRKVGAALAPTSATVPLDKHHVYATKSDGVKWQGITVDRSSRASSSSTGAPPSDISTIARILSTHSSTGKVSPNVSAIARSSADMAARTNLCPAFATSVSPPRMVCAATSSMARATCSQTM